MAKRETIGTRTMSELYRLFPDKSVTEIAGILGTQRETLYRWENRGDPLARYIAEMLVLGADVEYILIGRRSANGNRTEAR